MKCSHLVQPVSKSSSHLAEVKLYTCLKQFPFSLLPSLWHLPFYFVLLKLDCSGYLMSAVIQHLSFYDLSIMSSSHLHVVACVGIAFLVKAEQYAVVGREHVLLICSCVDEHLVASTSWSSYIMLLCTQVYQ